MAKRLGTRFLELNKYPFVKVKVENPIFFNEVRLSKPLLDSDVFINVPTLKTHVQCGITVAIKNMYGLIPPEDRRYYHSINRVEEAIVDLYQARKADLIVIDGTYTTFHIGPRPLKDFKETFRLDLTLASFDPVAVDAVSARILGVDPLSLRYLKWAEKRGLGTRDLDEIKIIGMPMEEACFSKTVGAVEFVNARMKNARIMNFSACTGCLQLPVQIMRFSDDLKGKKFVFVIGPSAAADDVKKSLKSEEVVVLCGYCAAPTYYNELDGYFVPGCPPQPEDLQRSIKEIIMHNV